MDRFLFQPCEAEVERRAKLHAKRKTPQSCGNRPGRNRRRKPQQQPGEHYSVESYRRAIHRGCDLAGIRSWSPNRLRHNAATRLRAEFGVVREREFHSQHLYELEGFRKLFTESLVCRIKALEEVLPAEVPMPKVLALRVRDRELIELFESLDARVVRARDGCVRMHLGSTCHRLEVFVTLDFAQESLISDPLSDIKFRDDGTPDAAKMMLQCAQLHRWWFGSNGTIELWDAATGTRLARAQPYRPPVNARFPHKEYAKMEAELRARAGIPDSTKRVEK